MVVTHLKIIFQNLAATIFFNVLKDNYKNLFKVEISQDRWVVYDKNNVSYFINKKNSHL